MRRTLLTLTVCIVLGLIAVAAFAQAAQTPPAPPAPPKMPSPSDTVRPVPSILPTLRIIGPQMVPMLASRLNLSDDQKTKVTELLDKAEVDLKPKIESQIKLAGDYTSLLIDPNAKQDQLAAAGEKEMKAETEVLMAKIQTLFALKSLLNADQNKQLTEYLALHTRPWREIAATPGPPTSTPAKPEATK